MVVVGPTASFAPESAHALQSLRLPGRGLLDRDDETGVGVGHDLVVGRVPVVLRLLGHPVDAGGHQGAVHDEHRVLRESLEGLERELGTQVTDDPVSGRPGDTEQRRELAQSQVRAPAAHGQQNPVLQGPTPWPPASRLALVLAVHHGHRLAEAARAQPGERGCPGRLRRRDHTSHTKIVAPGTGPYGQSLAGGPLTQVVRCVSPWRRRHRVPPSGPRPGRLGGGRGRPTRAGGRR